MTWTNKLGPEMGVHGQHCSFFELDTTLHTKRLTSAEFPEGTAGLAFMVDGVRNVLNALGTGSARDVRVKLVDPAQSDLVLLDMASNQVWNDTENEADELQQGVTPLNAQIGGSPSVRVGGLPFGLVVCAGFDLLIEGIQMESADELSTIVRGRFFSPTLGAL